MGGERFGEKKDCSGAWANVATIRFVIGGNGACCGTSCRRWPDGNTGPGEPYVPRYPDAGECFFSWCRDYEMGYDTGDKNKVCKGDVIHPNVSGKVKVSTTG